jgi:hypothetical protein
MSFLYQHSILLWTVLQFERNETSRRRRARCGVLMAVMGASVFSVVASILLVNNDDSLHNNASPKRRLLFFCNSLLGTGGYIHCCGDTTLKKRNTLYVRKIY